MKKYFFFLTLVLGSCFSQEYILRVQVKNKNPFFGEPVLVELLTNQLINKFKGKYPEVNVIKHQNCAIEYDKNRRVYTYDINIEESDINLKSGFYALWEQVLEEVNQLDFNKPSELVFDSMIKQDEKKSFEDCKHIFLDSLYLDIGLKNEIFSQIKDQVIIEEKKYIIQPVGYRPGYEFFIQATEKQKKIIGEIISEMGNKGLVSLLKKKSEMDRLGKQIEDVPPMDFMAVIFTQNNLKNHMHSIRKNYFKWSSLIDGFANNMNKERKYPDFKEKVISFAEFVGVDSNILLDRAHLKDWEGFVNILIEH